MLCLCSGLSVFQFSTHAQVECGEYQQKVLQARQAEGNLCPGPIFTNVETFTAADLPAGVKPKGYIGGFPCQVSLVAMGH